MKAIFVCLIVAFITACASKSAYHQHSRVDSQLGALKAAYIDYNVKNEKIHVDTMPSGNDLARSIDSMNQGIAQNLSAQTYPSQSAANQAATAGAAGSLLGTMLLVSMQQNAELEAANSKAQTLRDTLADIDFNQLIQQRLESDQIKIAHIDLYPKSQSQPDFGRITLDPHIKFSNDMGVLKIKLDMSIYLPTAKGKNKRNGSRYKNKGQIYKNSFEYWSVPIERSPNPDDHVDQWSANNAELFHRELTSGFKQLKQLMSQDVASSVSSSHDILGASKSIKIKNDFGTYFERGIVLSEANGQIIFRDLRGNLRIIHGSIFQ